MTTAKGSVDVKTYVTAAYNQWTQFEDFPKFMDGVEEVTQVGDRHLHWRVKIAGVEREFDATITEQVPDTRIAWKADGETKHAGVVDFHKLDMETTRVDLQLDMEPEGLVETVGDKLGVVERRVKKDLERFKELVESQPHPTGAWRGEVPREG
ncbi:SRPBCC family protein [Knoellia sp. p5-6-4]|jgi:uncharacterized membrane protein|uniref:SRPBCC family protein n=1 Tax=unclassified Knoellia TaxID=2618719 RepID=UPI0023DB699E|nr:SRPBCC family protein [Knoellia sp. p5-6-4]MDF2146148.1 SRPBCC family protein [Knoellia sp. p5-6-4]